MRLRTFLLPLLLVLSCAAHSRSPGISASISLLW